MCVCGPTLSLAHLVLVGSVGLRLRRRALAEETHERAPFALAVDGAITKQYQRKYRFFGFTCSGVP